MKRYFITILLCTFIQALIGQTDTYINKYDSILDPLFNAHKTEELLKFLENEIKVKPKNVDALRYLGYVHLNLTKKFDLVRKYYNEALLITPNCSACLINIGLSYLNENESKKGLEYFDKAINIDPSDGYCYCVRGKIKDGMGDNTGAFMDFNKAIQLSPKEPNFYTERSRFNVKSGYFYPALSDANKAIELFPKEILPAAYFERSEVYSKFAKYSDAIPDLNEAISLDSANSFYHFARANVYSYMDSINKSIIDFKTAIRLNSNDYRPLINLTHLLVKKEEIDLGCEYAQKTHRVLIKMDADSSLKSDFTLIKEDICDNNRASFYYHRAISAFMKKEVSESEKLCNLTLEKFPGNFFALNARADVYYSSGKYQQAINDYQTIFKKDRKTLLEELKANYRFRFINKDTINLYIQNFNCAMHMNMAQCQIALGNYDKALVEIDSCINLILPILEQKEFPFQVRGTIFLIKGKYSEALKNFDTCIVLNSFSVTDYVNRAVARMGIASNLKLKYVVAVRKWPLEPFYAEWIFPSKQVSDSYSQDLFRALEDCDKAIDIDKKCAYAYYIRGQVKKMLKREGFCDDVLKAKKLSYSVTQEVLKECSN